MQGLTSGQTLSDRFRLIRRLGQGGMGEVWLAEDTSLGDPVALKILGPALAGDDQFVSLLRDECRKARQLIHPNIVRVFDFHEGDHAPYISMEYIDGDSLAAMRGAPFQSIVRAGLMVSEALDYAHRSGIVHRDIKASNVLTADGSRCVLADFGVSAATGADTSGKPMSGGGSLPSMSPQQLDGGPPVVADDVYAFGALLFDLLAGHALFTPDPTPERIRTEVPEIPVHDGTGQPLPAALKRLVAAMLEKVPERRPAGMGAVRAVLEEVLADHVQATPPETADRAPAIRPVSRAAGQATDPLRPPAQPAKRSTALPGKLVFVGLGILLLIAFGVIFVLPDVVREQRPATIEREVERRIEAQNPEASDPQPGTDAQRELVDSVLGELLPLEDRLRSAAVERWGGTDWAEVRRLIEAGDMAYRNRDFGVALSSYRDALGLMQAIEPRIEQVLAEAIESGQRAVEAGDQPSAIDRFELALAIEPGNDAARNGLERAMSLDRVLALMAEAAEREQAGNFVAAREAYRDVLSIDAEWKPASERLARLDAAQATETYEVQMANGFRALNARDYGTARAAFEAALRVRPGDAQASAALAEISSQQRLARVVALTDQARRDEADEDWSAAIEAYEAALAIDATVTMASEGLERSRARLALGRSLDATIARADRLNEDAVWQAADQLLTQARGIDTPGPLLASQIDRLAGLLTSARIPVPVRFQSDSQTEVVIYKVGRLGRFDARTLDLRPGRYVAVGSRDGYRDVRREFMVVADGTMSAIVLRCEDPI